MEASTWGTGGEKAQYWKGKAVETKSGDNGIKSGADKIGLENYSKGIKQQ